MEGESKKALKYLTNQPASVHNYGKLNKSESPRTHSSPTSILRKFPHSLRHDQKHQTKIKRDATSGTPAAGRGEGKANRRVESWCTGDEGSDDSEERLSSSDTGKCRDEEEEGEGEDDSRKKRKFSLTSSECSSDGEVWKLQPSLEEQPRKEKFAREAAAGGEARGRGEKTVKSVRKLSVINTSCKRLGSASGGPEPGRKMEFPTHKSTPNLLRSETFSISTSLSQPGGGKAPSGRDFERNHRHVPLKTSDSLPQLDQTYRIIHSILPRINRTISESHESLSSLKNRKPYVKSEPHIESFHNRLNRAESVRSKIFDVGGRSDGSQSEEESEGSGLIDGRRSALVQNAKGRKGRWSYKKTIELVPSLRQLMSRRSRSGGDGEGGGPPGPAEPLVPPGDSPRPGICSSLSIPQIRCFDEDDEDLPVKKCGTAHALTSLLRAESNLQVEPIKPINRLRVPPNGFSGSTSRMCSRCSSLLSMASSSRYSINTTGSGFVSCSSPSSEKPPEPSILCKLCLMEVPVSLSMEINHCGCVFCKDCMRLYVEFEIQEGAYDISCPDAQCMKQGVVTIAEVEVLVSSLMMERYLRFRLNHEVDMDRNRTWCPRAGCETVCDICPREKCAPTSVHCPTCDSDFCSNCKNTWHQGLSCEENSRKLAREGRSDFMEPGIPFDSDSIKCCPMCNVPIEKDEGCAQMMCKRCKHVFCWYCLASLDDDFLLRHYDKGPCKNKLGHSRASVIWHRTQVIGIFAGLGLLLLVASPLLLLAAPCIVCCKCRVCSGTKLDADDDLPEESGT